MLRLPAIHHQVQSLTGSSIPMSVRKLLSPEGGSASIGLFSPAGEAVHALRREARGCAFAISQLRWPARTTGKCFIKLFEGKGKDWYSSMLFSNQFVQYDFSNPAMVVAAQVGLWLGGVVWTDKAAACTPPMVVFQTKETARLHLSICFLLYVGNSACLRDLGERLARSVKPYKFLEVNEFAVLKVQRFNNMTGVRLNNTAPDGAHLNPNFLTLIRREHDYVLGFMYACLNPDTNQMETVVTNTDKHASFYVSLGGGGDVGEDDDGDAVEGL